MTLYIDTRPKLKWVEDKDVPRLIILTAKTEFGDYKITYKHSDTGKNCKVETPPKDGKPVAPDLFFAMSEGKMFAQADYERRTAERFKPITLPERMNARLGDGSVHYCTGWNDVLDQLERNIQSAMKGE